MPLLPAQDFKRARDGDQGPNTGGMGAYAPLPWAPADLAERALASVIQPAVDVMRRRGTPYRGLLYAGLCLTPAGLRVVEFNARFGDPETQVVLDRLGTPLAPLLHAAAVGDLAAAAPPPWPRWRPGAAVVVVIAAEGYPGRPVTGDTIKIIEAERTGVTRPGDPSAPSGPTQSCRISLGRLSLGRLSPGRRTSCMRAPRWAGRAPVPRGSSCRPAAGC